jgi:hypothetical protein
MSLYTREAPVALPGGKNDLATIYTTKEEQDVYKNDAIYVALSAAATKYLIHQFKKLNDNTKDHIRVRVDLKSSLAPTDSAVYLQVWNGKTNAWETQDSNNTEAADTDFSLYADITEATFRDGSWYDFNNEFAARVWQLNNQGTQSLSIDLVQISFLIAYEDQYTTDEDCPPNEYSPLYPHANPQDDAEGDKFN